MIETSDKAELIVADENLLSKKINIEPLTGLRFFAALLVFICHVPKLDDWFDNNEKFHFTILGYAGVTLFFILSGFVMTLNYFDWFANTGFITKLKPFFVARFARIYPVFLFSFILAFFLLPNVGNPSNANGDFWPALLHLFLLQAWHPDIYFSAYAFNGVAWSISVEVFFYLVFPFLVIFILKRIKTIPFTLLIGVLTILLSFGIRLFLTNQTGIQSDDLRYFSYFFPPIRLLDFVLGCLSARLFLLVKNKPILKPEKTLGQIGIVGSILFSFLIWLFFKPSLTIYYYDSIFILPFVALIYCLARYPLPNFLKFLKNKIFILLGEASYSFYLLHFIIIELTNARLEETKGILFYCFYLVVLFLFTIFISIGSYFFIEKPARAFIKRKFDK